MLFYKGEGSVIYSGLILPLDFAHTTDDYVDNKMRGAQVPTLAELSCEWRRFENNFEVFARSMQYIGLEKLACGTIGFNWYTWLFGTSRRSHERKFVFASSVTENKQQFSDRFRLER